ncbi:MAG: hypothetical protein QXK76_02060 [Candidatus Woesearchaeota archaeon]
MTDNIKEMYDFVFNLDKRLMYLEKDLPFIEKRIDALKAYEENLYSKLNLDITELRNIFNETNISLKKLITNLSIISLDSKGLLKKEQYDLLKEKVDEIPINDYLTKKELKNI